MKGTTDLDGSQSIITAGRTGRMTIDGKGRYVVGGYVFDTGLSYVTRLLVKYPRHR